MPRPVTLVSVLILAGAGVAVVDAQSPYALPETPVSGTAFSLASTSKCIPSPYVLVLKVAAPAGAAFNSIDVTVDGRTSTTMTGATTGSRNQVYLGPGTSEIAIEATTPGGQRASVTRSYKTCAAPKAKKKTKRKVTKKPSVTKPKPASGSPITEGGGED